MLAVHGDWVKKETLAVDLEVTAAGDGADRRGSRRGRAGRRLPRGAQGQRVAGDRGGLEGPGVKTVLTYGTYDLLHKGHVLLLATRQTTGRPS